jgi:hypothetical protein
MRFPTLPPLRPALVLAVIAATNGAHAADINPMLLTQTEFRALSEDMGAVASFKPLIPAEPMGITGFDIGIAVTGTRLQHRDVWKKATGDNDFPATLPVPMVRVHKGLPFDVDVGVSYAQVPSTNVKIVGGELRWAFVPGSTAVPAVAVRASLSSVTGVDHLSLRTSGVDLSVSKGFAFLTPYAGVGVVHVKSTPDSPLASRESFNQNKVFAGLNLNLGLANILLETDKTGGATSYGVKFGVRF